MNESVIATIKENKNEFDSTDDLSHLINSVKNKKIVMLGEASHGTHEYYNWRARISKILMEEHGFDFVAVEGDWPACYELNRHVKNYEGTPAETNEILKHFDRWPSWMWANWEVHEWAEWLRAFNKGKSL
ncbi:MAG: erythromycin esterase family protein, partial [Brumimicrobium sp.]|nr:erythromycin esterase family protein [Brumimicrobium sp.]